MDSWFWLWLVIAVSLSVGEIFTAGFFLLPIGLGAALAAVANLLGLSLAMQWVVFGGASVLMLFTMRRFAEHVTHESPQRVAGDRLIGREGIVIAALRPHNTVGMVRVDREEWRADAIGEDPIVEGARVVVVSVEGTHLIVRPAEPGTAANQEVNR